LVAALGRRLRLDVMAAGAAGGSCCKSSVKQRLLEQRVAEAAGAVLDARRRTRMQPDQRQALAVGAARVACCGCCVHQHPGLVATGAVRDGGCLGSAGRRRRLLEQLQALAAGAARVACCGQGVANSSCSGQSLQEQRETEAAWAARDAGGDCGSSFRRWLLEQLRSLAVDAACSSSS
jgi:hypothetical protein